MKLLFQTAFWLFLSYTTLAQNRNCNPYNGNLQLQNSFDSKKQENRMNNAAYTTTLNGSAAANRTITLTIPVVFHVVHQNGPENIPDSIIYQTINGLNHRFSNTAPYHYSNSIDVQIQFCLASIDPYGNPTTGITRDTSVWSNFTAVTTLGGNPDINMKNVNRWNPIRYLNVWLPKQTVSIMGTNAYSSFPWYIGKENDGIVIEALSLGGSNYLITHEVGHYLGLYHNDEGDSCVNYNCLLDGDHVCDTPPEYRPATCGVSSCNTDLDDTTGIHPFSVDTVDLSNVMLPILPCNDLVFTQGQADRMNYFLSNVRYKLLDAASCSGVFPAIAPPTAGIHVNGTGCHGYLLTYTGIGAEFIEWDVNNDGYYELEGDSVTFSYGAAGYYTIKQRVFNGAGWAQDSIRIYAQNTNDTNFPIITAVSSNPSNNGNFLCDGAQLTLTAIPNMAHYYWSTGETTQTITVTANGPVTVSLSCIDSLGVIWKHCPDSTFSWGIFPSPAPFTLQVLTNDTLCEGQTFKALIPSQPGVHPWQIFTNDFPSIIQDTVILNYWQNQNVWLAVEVATANYCKRTSDTVTVTFSRTIPGPLTPGQNGFTLWTTDSAVNHQWYLNGILMVGATTDTILAMVNGCYTYAAWDIDADCATISTDVCITTADIPELKKYAIHVYPNPANDNCIIEFTGTTPLNIQLHDVMGRIVQTDVERLTSNKFKLLTFGMPNGIYILSIGEEKVPLLIQHEQ